MLVMFLSFIAFAFTAFASIACVFIAFTSIEFMSIAFMSIAFTSVSVVPSLFHFYCLRLSPTLFSTVSLWFTIPS